MRYSIPVALMAALLTPAVLSAAPIDVRATVVIGQNRPAPRVVAVERERDRRDRRVVVVREPMRFAGMDRNHDGVITRKEWRGNKSEFREFDWNRDGILSGAELRPRGVRRR